MTRPISVRRALVGGLVIAFLIAVGGSAAGGRLRSKAVPICEVLKTSLNGGTTLGQSLSVDQVFADRQQTAVDLTYYAKKGPSAIRSSLKTLANAYKQLVALGRPIDDQVDPTGADTQRTAIGQILQASAFLNAVKKISLYSAVRLHCNLNP